jgi:hypothetical protein
MSPQSIQSSLKDNQSLSKAQGPRVGRYPIREERRKGIGLPTGVLVIIFKDTFFMCFFFR